MDNNFKYLLIALLVFLLGVPLAFDLQLLPGGVIRAIGFSALLAVGIWSLRNSGRLFRVAVVIVIASLALNTVAAILGDSLSYLGSLLLLLAFLLLAAFASMRQIVLDNSVSANRIIGAICVYLLLGVIWSLVYALLDFAIPGSFSGMPEQSGANWNPGWVYYSFITLTTLGYGDILPLTFSARALSYMETITGQFYLAVLVAGLVSAYLSTRQESSRSK